jgi:hypothetical protein
MGNGSGTANTYNGLPSAVPDGGGSVINRGIPCTGDIRRAGDGPQTWDPATLDSSGTFSSPDGSTNIKSDTPANNPGTVLGGDGVPTIYDVSGIAGGPKSGDSSAEGSNAAHSPARRG